MNGIRGLSDRQNQQLGVAVTSVAPALEVLGGIVYVEDADWVVLTLFVSGINALSTVKVERNNFDKGDPVASGHWELVDDQIFLNLASGQVRQLVMQAKGVKWLRVRGSCVGGAPTAVDIAWTGH